ncbi:MAG: hypothetical protein HZA64_03415 [Rhodocyclales bacterium]|nr:hypothetical protein [Rhodocyclales bacterium]
MSALRQFYFAISIALTLAASSAAADDINLLPKYGSAAKNDAQKAADANFLATIDNFYKGDQKKAAGEVAARGWQFLRQGNTADAMRRFNQAWLIDSTNAHALWGMAAVSGSKGDLDQSLKLFSEAERFVGSDVDFAVDQAKTIGLAGAQSNDKALLHDAFARFARLYERAPQHTLNLQNWAVTYFYVGNYAEAWKKLKLAEATPRKAAIDPGFVAALQEKMPRP